MSGKCAYTVVRANRRTVGITVRPGGEVIVRAPCRMPLAEINAAVERHRDWLEKAVEKSKSLPSPPDAATQNALRGKAERVLPGLVERWAKTVGVRPASVRVTAARTRFGSCSGKDRLCFSLFLLQYPPEAVEYVVVHELCHILHHDHSGAFWREVERFLPDYRDRAALLKKPPQV